MDIKIQVENDKVAKYFIEMISYMEYCGNVGHCGGFHVNFDGDGRAKIKVETDNQEEYVEQRKKWLDDSYIKEKVFDGELRFSID